jgi:protein-S-isoprenylcysteine O-methyltransferase Ste14
MTKYILPVYFLLCIVYTGLMVILGHWVAAVALGSLTTFCITMKVREVKYKLDAEKRAELQ